MKIVLVHSCGSMNPIYIFDFDFLSMETAQYLRRQRILKSKILLLLNMPIRRSNFHGLPRF